VPRLGKRETGAVGGSGNDGWLDLFCVDDARNFVRFQNNGDGTFTRVDGGGLENDGSHTSGGAAWVDYDNDGFLDLFLACGQETAREPNLLFHNSGNSNHWLTINCVGAVSNRSGVGAKVRVKTVIDGNTHCQYREINTGNGYLASSPLRAHFGLGASANVDMVRIEWPSGTVQELRNVAANQLLTVTEPPRLQAVGRLPDGSFQIQLTGGIGFRYAVETSSNLTSWTPWTNVTNTSRTITVNDPSATNATRRFYRARLN
jgi:hypothetical protein